MKKLFFFAILLSAFCSCDLPGSKEEQSKDSVQVLNEGDIIQQQFFSDLLVKTQILEVYDSVDFGCHGITINLRGKTVYSDSSDEYLICGSKSISANHPSEDVYEVFLVSDSRPSDIRTAHFTINNGVCTKEIIPNFLNILQNLDADTNKEYAGIKFDASELPCAAGPCDSIWYYPILCYEETAEGLKLDSSLTVSENEKVYGKFYGFKNDEKIILPAYKKLMTEKERLEKIELYLIQNSNKKIRND